MLFISLNTNNIYAVITGSGTSYDPYKIHNESDLQTIMSNSSYWAAGVFIELASNLDMNGYVCTPIGTETIIITTPYEGNFNGKGYSINNFTLSSGYNLGLFGYIGSNGVVKNVKLINATVTGTHWNGLFCGQNNGLIHHCSSSGNIVSSSGAAGGFCWENYGTIHHCFSNAIASGLSDVGGFCGHNYGFIYICYSTGDVTCTISYEGGFVGRNMDGAIIRNCYSLGNVIATSLPFFYQGGFCGINANSTIEYCYSMGVVSGSDDRFCAGFVGYTWGQLNCNYWGFQNATLYDTDVVDLPDYQIKQISTFDFANELSFPCFNFEGIWYIKNDHPAFIPTLSVWAAILFIILIGIFGGIYINKKLL